MPEIVIELAGVPIGKGRPRFSRKSGVAFTPAKTRVFESALRYAAQEAMNGRPPIEGAISVSIIASFPIPVSWSKKKKAALLISNHHTKRPDCDNIIKCLDSMNEIVWRDDAQIAESSIIKRYSNRPSLLITVKSL